MATYEYDATNTLESKGQILEFYQTFSGATVFFKAFLTSYNESFNCRWTPTAVFGRPDPIQTYQNTTRNLTLGWKIPAYSEFDAQENLVKTSTLARMLYPEYSSVDNANTISKGPLVKIKFANLIYDAGRGPGGDVRTSGLLGVIKNLSWRPELKEGFFDPGNRLYPKLITLSIGFDVLHQHTLGWEKAEAVALTSEQEDSIKKKHEDEFGADPVSDAAGNADISEINDSRESQALNAAPSWGSDAALFPWSAGLQRTSTNVGTTTGDDIAAAHEEAALEGND